MGVDRGFPQAPCDSLWCCQWYDGCWSSVGDKKCPLVSGSCAILHEDRASCGWRGINKAECNMLECCWDPLPSNPHQVPSCFFQVGRCAGVCSRAEHVDKSEQPNYCKGNICHADECCDDAA